MEYKNLGSLKVSRLAFGCMSLSTDYPKSAALLHQAVDLGINFFDTADLYNKGRNEEIVGKALKEKRASVFIATKVGNQWRPDGSGWDWNPTKAYILEAVHSSLKRLQTDYIDLYQLHGGTIDDPIDETIEAFESLKQQGLIREYGISSIRHNVIRAYVQQSNIVSNMMQYSLLDRRPEELALDLLANQGIGVIVRGGVAKGLLAGKPKAAYLNYGTDEVAKLQEQLSAIAGPRSLAQTALQYCLSNPAITTVAAGIRTAEQLEDNAGVFEQAMLDDSALLQLKAVLEPAQYTNHR